MPFLQNTGRPADTGSLTLSLRPLHPLHPLRPRLPITVLQSPWARSCVVALSLGILSACSGKDAAIVFSGVPLALTGGAAARLAAMTPPGMTI